MLLKTDMIEDMRKEMQDVVENNILRFWMEKMVDHENGGFYGRIDGQEVLHADAEKGLSSMPVFFGRSPQPTGCWEIRNT